MPLQAYIFVSLTLVLAAYCTRRFKSPWRNLPLPPGPKHLPIIGNMLDMPPNLDFIWETYDKWFKEFRSDVVYINLVGSSIVIVNTYEAAVELFERRSALYSNRLCSPMVNELTGLDWALGLIPYGNKWRCYRRLFHQGFNVNASKQFEPRQTKAAHQLLLRLIDRPDSQNLIEHFRHMTGSVIMDIVYGIKILPDDDPHIRLAERTACIMRELTVPGKWLVDLFPWLKYVPEWFPGTVFRRQAVKWEVEIREMIERPFEEVKRMMDIGRFIPSFTSQTLEIIGHSSALFRDEKAVKEVAGVALGAGTDTTVSALGTFALAMLKYPEVQKRAQTELDAVLNGRLPTFRDQNSLPYVTAVVLEAFRWKAVTPIGIPHSLISDDIYQGYRIPAGSMVIANSWSMFYDEEMYPDPATFNPDRFLKNGKFNAAVRDPRLIAFGFGRRICPGRYMAYSTVWIAAASVLATMDIKKALDHDGKVIEPSGEYISGAIQTPKPFVCRTNLRSKNIEALVRRTMLGEE